MPSSQTTLSPKNIIRSIRERDHQRHSSESDWGFAPPNDVAFLPSEWRDINVLPSPAVAAANLLLPDVIKGCRSSEWRRRPFLGFPLPLSGGTRRHTRASTLSRRSLSGPTPDAGTLRGWEGGACTRKHSQWIKKLFYHHHLARHLKTLLECERGIGFAHTAVPQRQSQESRKSSAASGGVIENFTSVAFWCSKGKQIWRSKFTREEEEEEPRKTIKISCKVCKVLSCVVQSWGTMEILKKKILIKHYCNWCFTSFNFFL